MHEQITEPREETHHILNNRFFRALLVMLMLYVIFSLIVGITLVVISYPWTGIIVAVLFSYSMCYVMVE
jgi:hypothetical protein